MNERERGFWLIVRRAFIMILNALEDYLEVGRTIPPKEER